MSVVLEFSQITNKEESAITFLKSCNLYEIDQSKSQRGRGCYIRNTELFQEIFTNRDAWKGEVYNIPMMHNYLFYVLAMDFENNVGHRLENDKVIFLGFDPKPIHRVISQAKKDVPKIVNNFDELQSILEEAIEKDYLINVYWG
ncbi:MAG: hypothetical protein MI974_25540 [Chitinophagales bacterium]|nr:hypothetical protein [Chitinophagales bacterium]